MTKMKTEMTVGRTKKTKATSDSMTFGAQYSLLKNFGSLEAQQLFERRLLDFCKEDDAIALGVTQQEDGTVRMVELHPRLPVIGGKDATII